MIQTRPPLLAILGLTASGKSSLAEALCTDFGGELINGDASAVYRELSVGVTKPDQESRQKYRYHLLDVASLSTGYTIADFETDANQAIKEIHQRANLPILVGGSGLYNRCLLDGYRLPSIEIPENIRNWVRSLGLDRAVDELKKRDEASWTRVDLANPRRVERALELVVANGGPVEPATVVPRTDLRILRITLMPEKPILRRRIEERTRSMWSDWQEEVVQLEKKGLGDGIDARKPIGYSFVKAYLRGELTKEEAISAVIRQTVNLSKRQRTWLRRELPHPDSHIWHLKCEKDWESLVDKAAKLLEEFLSRDSKSKGK